jgi:polyisoprenoid-binding protein YceI
MNESRTITIGLAAMGLLVVLSPGAMADNYKIDPEHSQVIFRVEHLGVSHNYGRFNDISGNYSFDPEDPSSSSFEVTIKADSVDTHSERRDQHLKSPDFFNAKQFPAIQFKSKSVKQKDDGLEATGQLTLHGVKRDVTVEIKHVGSGEDPWKNYRSGFVTTFAIKRSDFDMKFMMGPLGDEVTLMVNIEGIRE